MPAAGNLADACKLFRTTDFAKEPRIEFDARRGVEFDTRKKVEFDTKKTRRSLRPEFDETVGLKTVLKPPELLEPIRRQDPLVKESL